MIAHSPSHRVVKTASVLSVKKIIPFHWFSITWGIFEQSRKSVDRIKSTFKMKKYQSERVLHKFAISNRHIKDGFLMPVWAIWMPVQRSWWKKNDSSGLDLTQPGQTALAQLAGYLQLNFPHLDSFTVVAVVQFYKFKGSMGSFYWWPKLTVAANVNWIYFSAFREEVQILPRNVLGCENPAKEKEHLWFPFLEVSKVFKRRALLTERRAHLMTNSPLFARAGHACQTVLGQCVIVLPWVSPDVRSLSTVDSCLQSRPYLVLSRFEKGLERRD